MERVRSMLITYFGVTSYTEERQPFAWDGLSSHVVSLAVAMAMSDTSSIGVICLVKQSIANNKKNCYTVETVHNIDYVSAIVIRDIEV